MRKKWMIGFVVLAACAAPSHAAVIYSENLTGETDAGAGATPEVDTYSAGRLESSGTAQTFGNGVWQLKNPITGTRGLRIGDTDATMFNWGTGAAAAAIANAGGFSVSFDWDEQGKTGAETWIGIKVGSYDASAPIAGGPNSSSIDLGARLYYDGEARTFDSGARLDFTANSHASQTQTVEFRYEFDSFASGSSVDFTMVVDGTEWATDTFTWDTDNDVRIFFGGGTQSADTFVDNIEISTITEPATRPNILVIVADDHRQDLIGKYHDIIQTPTLDDLCNQGVFFQNAYVTTPICAASRASIFTGLTERTHGYTFGEPAVPTEFTATAYPKVLKENGYRTGFVGKFGCSLTGSNEERFDWYDERSQRINESYNGESIPQTYYMANSACDFIEDSSLNHVGTPWCMSVSFWNPHAHDADRENQYYYPPEFETLYDDVTIPEARISDTGTFNSLPDFIKTSMCRTRWGWRYDTPEKYQKMVKRHYRAISGVDKGVQMIRDKLTALGIADNTVIIYIGDNGYMMNERQLAGKWLGWEECLRVPLIVYDPRPETLHGAELDQEALNIDLAPTIMDLAGIDIPSMYQGRSLYPLLTGENPPWRKEFFFEHYYSASGRIPRNEGVWTERWKYVNFTLDMHEQLYDLQNDPGEKTNLVDNASYADTLQYLRNSSSAYIDLYSEWPQESVLPETTTELYIDNKNTDLLYTGTWARQADALDFDGSMEWSSQSGATVEYSITNATSVQVVVRKGGAGGVCDVYLDEALVAAGVDTYAPDKTYQTVIYETTLDEGAHAIKLVARASGNVMFDYFSFGGEFFEVPPDRDADGLPDEWEVRYLETLSKLAGGDEDQDGSLNQEEYIAGTDPQSSASVFSVQGVPPVSAREFSLEWNSVLGRVYTVRMSSSLLDENWSVVSNFPATGGTIRFEDKIEGETNGYYQVEVKIP